MTAGVVLFVGLTAVGQTPSSSQSVWHLDEAAFRQGLRQRGLNELLEQYYADVEPVSEIDRQLRQREELLEQSEQADLKPCQRKELVHQGSEILRDLIEAHPKHSACVRWQLQLARDLIERYAPEAFDALLLYEMPGEDRETVQRLAGEATRLLRSARQGIHQKWRTIESLDEETLYKEYTPSTLRLLEHTDTRSAILLVWARLYEALSNPQTEQSRATFAALLRQVKEEYGWTALPLDRADLRCNSLAIAALCARHLGQYEQAGKYSREIVAALKHVGDAEMRWRLRKTVLLGILEQIRTLRDTGQTKKAFGGLEQARLWAQRSWPNNLKVELALALTKRNVLRAKQELAPVIGNTLADFLQPVESLEPLRELAGQSPTARDSLYATLSGVLSGVSPQSDFNLLQMQLLAGATIAGILAECDDVPNQKNEALEAIINHLESFLHNLPADTFSADRGELMYLLGRGYFLAERHLEAMQILTQLAEQDPGHDRAKDALRQATALAQQQLRLENDTESPVVRSAFIRAGKLLRRMAPADEDSRRLQYFIALALEKSSRLTEAIIEYGWVTKDDDHYLEAALGKGRCLRKRLQAAVENEETDKARELAEAALSAAKSASELACRHNPQKQTQTAGRIIILLANLQNHAMIDQPQKALETMEGFEQKFAKFTPLVGRSLRERILANRRLGRFEDARKTGAKLLKIDPKNTPPLLAELLETIRERIFSAEDEGDTQRVQRLAGEAHRLAEMLLKWCQEHPDVLEQQDLFIVRVWSAWAILKSGQAEQALERFENIDLASLQKDHPLHIECRLGRAECLLQTGRPQKALKLFMKTWREMAEGSDPWWRSYVGSLRCHTRLQNDPHEILHSIEQRRYHSPQLGAPRWKRAIEQVEAINRQHMSEAAPASQP